MNFFYRQKKEIHIDIPDKDIVVRVSERYHK